MTSPPPRLNSSNLPRLSRLTTGCRVRIAGIRFVDYFKMASGPIVRMPLFSTHSLQMAQRNRRSRWEYPGSAPMAVTVSH